MSTCVAALYAAAGAPSATTPAQDLVDTWASGGAGSDGFAMVFEDAGGTDAPSIYVKDSGTPANDTDINLTDDFDAFNSFLTYTSPSPKIVRQSDGNLKYCAHNLVDYSQDFTQWGDSGTNTSISSDADTDPDGYAADALIADATGSAVRRIQKGVTNINGSFPASMSVVAKAGSANHLRMTSNFVQDVWFNLSTGAVGTEQDGGTGSIEDLGGGWYRCTMHAASGFSSGTMYLNPSDTDAGFNTNVTDTANPIMYFSQAHGYLTPAVTTHLETTGSARYALGIQHDSSNNAEGLLVEPAATNLVTYSNDLTNAAWTKANMTTAKTATGPGGSSNEATTCTATAGNATALFSITSASAARVTSAYIKRRTGTGNIDLTQNNGSTWTTVAVDSNWTRFDIGPDTAANPIVGIRIVTSGDAVDVALFQHEVGSVPTSPIITTGATATRAQDHIDIADTDTPVTANPFTAYQKINLSRFTGRSLDFADGGNSNHYVQTNSSTLTWSSVDGTAQANISNGGAQSLNTDIKLAAAVNTDDFAFSVGGATVGTDTSGTVGAFTEINFGIQREGVNPMHGLIKEVLILPERLSNANLESLST